MRIKKLELIGFKSFKDRTVIQFDAGITGIVGPNGCGKSNIVDALVWVMGEMSAKHLRGTSMEDVIFSGAEGYAPMGMAEVSLTLENDGGAFPVQYLKHSEIMITRRLHRSGESEYYINRESARLRDIQEIFMDTGAGSKGFSIIEQGAIGRIITAKPEDRRMLIEEAAGITKFKVRKRESQRKLVATEQNLVRLADIVGELKRQIDSLHRQAQRAERYRNLKREIEDLELWLSSKSYLEVCESIEKYQVQLEEAETRELEAQSHVSTLEAELESIRADLSVRENSVGDLQNRHATLKHQVQKKESEIQELKFEIEQARRNKEMTGSLLQENEMRRSLLEADLNRIQETIATVRADAERLKLEFATKKEIYDNSSARIEEIDTELSAARREMLTVSQGESHISAKVLALEETIANIQEREVEVRSILEELLAKKIDFEARRNKVFTNLEKERQMQMDLSKDVETLEANKRTLTTQIHERRDEVEKFKDSLNEVTSRLYGLENMQSNFEGFQEGVKNVMFWQRSRLEQLTEEEREKAEHLRPVAEVVEVPGEYELAMEAALGPRLQMLLSANEGMALNAVDYLKENQSGRSSFYPANYAMQMVEATPEKEHLKSASGVKAVLEDVVRAPERFKPVVESLLRNVAVVETIRTAIELRSNFPGWTFVTPEGDLLDADGVLTGGTAESADSGVLKRRREIKDLSQRKEEWAGKLALAQTSLKKMEENLKTLIQDLEGAQKRNTEKEILLAELKKDLERAEQEISNVNHAISRQERDVMSVQQQIQTRQTEMEQLSERLEELREKKFTFESTIEQLTQEWQVSRGGIDELLQEVTTLQVSSATKSQERDGLERQLEMISKSFNEVNSQLTRMSEESTKSSETMSTNQILLEEEKVGLEAVIREVEILEQRVSQERNDYEMVYARAKEIEKILSSHLGTKNELMTSMNQARLHLDQARMKEQYLVSHIQERYILNLQDIAERYRDREGDVGEAEKSLKDLREKVSKIGDVNLSAIEEYEEVSKRFEFLSKQQTDLIEAKEQLKKVIDRINRICSRRFKETFDQVNERFTKVFPVLFGGGEAHLTLIEDPEKGEMGIDIVAKPPGKKPQNITLLSGGEKALTAVALIFSIFLVKPSPYCLLDEVDAPLDDANVFRFNDLVREMAKRSQIIIVTHNKHTMEAASRLYGVTQEDKGVSKMVSVNLGDNPV